MLKLSVAGIVVAVVVVGGIVEVRSQQPGPTIWLDSWWSGDYAKTGCDHAKEWMQDNKSIIDQKSCDAVISCPDMLLRYEACVSAVDPAAIAIRFEDELMTQFAIDSNCKGATLARFYGNDVKVSAATQAAMSDKRAWSLIIDYIVGAPAQSWTLQDHDHRVFLQGEGSTPAKVTADICAIVLGRVHIP